MMLSWSRHRPFTFRPQSSKAPTSAAVTARKSDSPLLATRVPYARGASTPSMWHRAVMASMTLYLQRSAWHARRWTTSASLPRLMTPYPPASVPELPEASVA